MVPAARAAGEVNSYGRDNTYGGYSNPLVVKDSFLLKIPSALRPEVAAPILCDGVTTYSPMKHWGIRSGQKVGVVGFGGLGILPARSPERWEPRSRFSPIRRRNSRRLAVSASRLEVED